LQLRRGNNGFIGTDHHQGAFQISLAPLKQLGFSQSMIGRNGFGIAAVVGFAAGLFDPVTFGASATLDLAANCAGVSPHNAGNLGGAMLGSHKALDLVAIFSAAASV
jgi:hypothetical protein